MDEQFQLAGLEPEEIEMWLASETAQIFPLLRGGLFHRTGIQGFRGIFNTGYILPNTGQFPTSYPQTREYYGFSRGYISVFDFHNIPDAYCISNYNIWGVFFFDHEPVTIVFRLRRDMLTDKLIPNDAAPKLDSLDYKSHIAYVEAWYPEPIPIAAIAGFLLVGYNRTTGALVFQEFDHSAYDEVDKLVTRFEELQIDNPRWES